MKPAHGVSPVPRRPRSDARLAMALLLGTGLVAACSAPWLQRQPGSQRGAEAEAEALDPVGVYDLTMSSETMVTEGKMEIRGEPDRYVGTVAVGGISGRIVKVMSGVGQLVVDVDTHAGRLVFRLAGDGSTLSGNWLLGERRGTVAAQRSRSG